MSRSKKSAVESVTTPASVEFAAKPYQVKSPKTDQDVVTPAAVDEPEAEKTLTTGAPVRLFDLACNMETALRRAQSLVRLLEDSVDGEDLSDRPAIDRMILSFEALLAALRHEFAELDELNQAVYLVNHQGGAHA